MIGKGLFALAWTLLIALGFGLGSGFLPRETKRGAQVVSGISPEREFSPVELKSFAIVLYAYNNVDWCERSLRSIFEQDYESFRLIFIDDGSRDATFDTVQRFIIENQQEHRALLIRNASPIGFLPSLYRAAQHCLDREIVVPLLAKDWLAGPSTLLYWNRAFQNPDAWIAFGRTIHYPSYDFLDPPHWEEKEIVKQGYRNAKENIAHCFYSALFKQLSVQSLLGPSATYLEPMLELSGARIKNVWEPVAFCNESVAARVSEKFSFKRSTNALEPLAAFPKHAGDQRQEADIVLFSSNRPMQLYAVLESIQQHVIGYRQIVVAYWADAFSAPAYEYMQSLFPQMAFYPQGKEYKRSLLKTIFDAPPAYILLGSDERIVKDLIDLRSCTEMLGKTRAKGFFLQVEHVHQPMPLSGDMCAFLSSGKESFAELDMAIYRTSDLKRFFTSARYEQFRDLQTAWRQTHRGESVYLTFDHSKAMAFPELFAKEELLSKFNQGLKFDLEPLYRGENLEFISR